MQPAFGRHFEPLQVESLKVIDHVDDDDNPVAVETILKGK